MTKRVTVTLPDDVVTWLDDIAEAEGTSRSEVVREASSRYVASRSADGVARDMQAAVDDGIAWLEDVAGHVQADPRSSTDILREIRGSDTEPVGRPIDPAYEGPGIP